MTPEEFRSLLDDISSCFIDEDFAPWRDRISLPFSLITQQGPVLLNTTEELQQNFEHYLLACRIMRLDAIVRRPVSLEDCGDGTFIATYRTEMLSHGQRQTAPYTSSALVTYVDGAWRMTSILNARGHHDWTGLKPNNKETSNV